jgi:hypothetical protein
MLMADKTKNLTRAGMGRKKGVPNRTPAALREVVAQFVENNAAGAQALYNRVASKNPAKALELLARFAEFVLPKQREITGTLASIHINADVPITDAAEAARVYQQMMGDPSIDITGLTFASPEPSPVAALEPIEVPARRALAVDVPEPVRPVRKALPDLAPVPPETPDSNDDVWSRLGQ